LQVQVSASDAVLVTLSRIYGSLFLDAGGLTLVFIRGFRLFRILGLNLRMLRHGYGSVDLGSDDFRFQMKL
jgi:hypothetical protein